jgi:hypothetical protein
MADRRKSCRQGLGDVMSVVEKAIGRSGKEIRLTEYAACAG